MTANVIHKNKSHGCVINITYFTPIIIWMRI